MWATTIEFLDDHESVLHDRALIETMRAQITDGAVYVVRRAVSPERIRQIRDYLTNVGRSSLPNYHRIEPGCPNFHRMNRWDPRAYVQGCFHQFVFFPWNQDLFDFFRMFAPVYHLKNLLSGLKAESFLGVEPEDGCTARLAFQFYPRGDGGLHLHQDPVDYHQLTVPIMIMSQKGRDFQQGGAFVEQQDGTRINLDEICELGDVVYFNARCRHGVELIDPDAELDWLSFQGRWMLLFAVNRLFDNRSIADSVDLERQK
jgi:hypothetical protein